MTPEQTEAAQAVHFFVWSGLYPPETIADGLREGWQTADGEDTLDPDWLAAQVATADAAYRAAVASWPETTDSDRLTRAFARLTEAGIVALENAGYTSTDGRGAVAAALAARPADAAPARGYTFYHQQDAEHALDGHGLYLAYGALTDQNGDAPQDTEAVGRAVVEALAAEGFVVDWNGSAKARLRLPGFAWKRRRDAA